MVSSSVRIKNKHRKDTCLKRTDYVPILWTPPHSIVNTIGSCTHVFNWGINKHALNYNNQYWIKRGPFLVRFVLMFPSMIFGLIPGFKAPVRPACWRWNFPWVSKTWSEPLLHFLLQHKFHSINLRGRSWRTWKTNQITPNEATSPRSLISPPLS
jgi:hypothetical protein